MNQPLRGLSGKVLPNHPKLLDGEMLTSWLVRTANANGMKIQRLLDEAVGRGVPTLTRDYDRFAPVAHLQHFSEMTGETLERLEAATLRRFEDTFVDKVVTNGNTRWILAQGIYHRKRYRHGLQYCPICLRLDAVPYFRTIWRCAFYVECADHHVQMEDACGACGAPVVPYRVELGKPRSTLGRDMVYCHNCAFDLRTSLPRQIEFPTWQLAVDLRSLILFHWSQQSVLRGAEKLTTREVFSDWWQAVAVIRTSVSTSLAPNSSMYSLIEAVCASKEIKRARNIEVLRLQDRIGLLLVGLWLMQDWPNNLKKARCCFNAQGKNVLVRKKHWSR